MLLRKCKRFCPFCAQIGSLIPLSLTISEVYSHQEFAQ